MTAIHFSKRSSFPSEENALARALRKHPPRVDLTLANPTEADLPYASDLLSILGDPNGLRYEPLSFGNEALREFLGARVALPTEQVLLTASTSEAYSFLFKLLADSGDIVHVPSPSYPLFEHLADLEGVRLEPYRLAYDGAWHIDFSSLVVGDRSRAILIVSPNNPTGHYLKRPELARLAEYGLPLVSDDVFFPYAHREDPSRASVLDAKDTNLVFSLRGLSKEAALPQLKLGWTYVDGPAPLLRESLRRLELIADTFLSVGTPIQLAARTILERQEPVQRAILERAIANHHALRERLGTTSEVTLLHLEGGWYATLRLPASRSEEDWVLELLAHEGVLVHPGHFFDFHEEPYVVVSLLVPEAEFRLGIDALLGYVERS